MTWSDQGTAGNAVTVVRSRRRRQRRTTAIRTLVSLLAVMNLAGCAGSTASPTSARSADPSAARSSIATPAGSGPTRTPPGSPTSALREVGTFVPTGDMKEPRLSATATLLTDGRVLIAGGGPSQPVDGASAVASAELYDPRTGEFARTGNMTMARTGAAATLLTDGRVLIVGGDGCPKLKICPDDLVEPSSGGGALASAELYDPTTGRFTATGSMNVPREGPTATLLPDGHVLILNGGSRLAELFDPTTGQFRRLGSLLNLSTSYTATLLPNGKVLVVGTNQPGIGAELFDPVSGSSLSVPVPLPAGVASPDDTDNIQIETTTLLRDGRALLQIFDFGALVNYLIIYDAETGKFAQAGTISGPAGWLPQTAVLLRDGRVLFMGGTIEHPGGVGGFEIADSAGLFDPASGFHLLSTKMAQARWYQTATALSDGTALIAGGIVDDQEGLTSAELFRP